MARKRSRAKRRERPVLAPRDVLTREIQRVLELVRPYIDRDDEPRYNGYCGAATEAYLHLAREQNGGRRPDLRVMRGVYYRTSHWWLEDAKGRVIDLTLAPADRRLEKDYPEDGYPYERGKGAAFQAQPGPSKRAAAIIALVKLERDR